MTLSWLSQLTARLSSLWRGVEPKYLSAETPLRGLPDFAPPGFCHGFEILNDPATPMDFVVDMLMRHCGMSRKAACEVMLQVHVKGGALVSTSSASEARLVCERISAEAVKAGHPLVCRPSEPEISVSGAAS